MAEYTSDALSGLGAQIAESIATVNQSAAPTGLESAPGGAALEGMVPTGSISAKGSQPDVLSKDARESMVTWAKSFAVIGLLAGTAITATIGLLDLSLADREVSGLWVWPTFAIILVAALGLVIAHFATMGYGTVELELDIGEQTGDGGNGNGGDDAEE